MATSSQVMGTGAQPGTSDPGATRQEVYGAVAAGCAIVAGVIHAAVAPAHYAESWWAGSFFVVVAVAQVALALALRWTLPVVVLVGALVGHLGVVLLYVASRTVELPFVAPHDAGHAVPHLPVAGGVGNGIPIYPGTRVEPVGALDIACLVAELVLMLMLAGLLPHRARMVVTTVMMLAGALVLVGRGALAVV
jgi:hypothetical protein